MKDKMYMVSKKCYEKEGVCQRGRVNCPLMIRVLRENAQGMAEMPYKSFTAVFAKEVTRFSYDINLPF